MAHARDVEAAGGDVGRHQDAVLAFAEALEGLHPLPLGQVGVDALHRMTLALQHVGEPLGVRLAADEDERAPQLLVEQGEQAGLLVLRLHAWIDRVAPVEVVAL